MIVQELRRIQERRGYLPVDELEALSKRISVPLRRLHEVASFYPLYRLEKPPQVTVHVCRDMACHLAGAPRLTGELSALANEIGGGQVRVCGVSCLGQCDKTPAVVIETAEPRQEYVYFSKSPEQLRDLVQRAAAAEKLPAQHAGATPPGWKIDIYNGQPTYEAVKAYIAKPDPDGVVAKLQTSGLRGMGGAGFPTFRKWDAVRKEPGDVKYVVCNADESEPGTFKDRDLMRIAPHLVIEGMILAALVTGAQQGYLYIRHEFQEEEHACEHAIKAAYAAGVLGKNILGSKFTFDLEVYVSPGGYIQGEESALLEAIEDRRGEPRNKPPFPTQAGLYGKPTVINNVETLSWTPGIITKGGEWYRDGGVRGAKGMRFVSISGDCNKPGVYEVPMGQTVEELIFKTAGGMSGGQTLKAIATSGPSGGFLPAQIKVEDLPAAFVEKFVPKGAKTFDVRQLPLDFDSCGLGRIMLGAAFVVYGSQRDMVDQALNCTAFYRNESCGKCVPCRLGSEKMTEMLEQIKGRGFKREQLAAVKELATTMEITSICGLGMVAANPFSYLIRFFPEDLEKYLG